MLHGKTRESGAQKFGSDELEVVSKCSTEKLHTVLDATRPPRLVERVDHSALHPQGQHLERDVFSVRILARTDGNAARLRLADFPGRYRRTAGRITVLVACA